MCTQHGRQRKKGGVFQSCLGVAWRNQFDQRCPGHDLIHLLQKLAFAGFLEVQVQSEGCLLHDKRFSQIWLTAGTNFWELCRVFLGVWIPYGESIDLKIELESFSVNQAAFSYDMGLEFYGKTYR